MVIQCNPFVANPPIFEIVGDPSPNPPISRRPCIQCRPNPAATLLVDITDTVKDYGENLALSTVNDAAILPFLYVTI